jgi:hypothetical protein
VSRHKTPGMDETSQVQALASEPQSFQKFRNRWGESSVYRTVCWMFLCPR